MSGASNHWAAQCVIAAQGNQPGQQTTTGAQQQQQQQQQYAASWQQYGSTWAQQRQAPYYYNYAVQQQQQQRIEQVKAAYQQPAQGDYGARFFLSLAGENASCAGEAVRRATAVAQQTKPKPNGMPPSLKAYAERAFATCTSDAERHEMQSRLHGIISSALNSGKLHETDWALAPVPTLSASSASTVAMPAKKKPKTEAERRQLASRAERFGPQLATRRGSGHTSPIVPQFQVLEPVKGTCTELEKDYFRLTSAPDPSVVRPQPVLERALQRLKDKWRSGEVDYDWACNQLKAIRQDLTVQCVKNKFAVNVYETHARVALENADMNEYNQCQSQLKELYASLGDGVGHPTEFVAYRILYYLYLQLTAAGGDKSASELLATLHEMPPQDWTLNAVAHALAVIRAVDSHDYATFFRLHKDAPNMGQYILDMCADKIRIDAAYRIAKAYRPSLPLDAVSRPDHRLQRRPPAARATPRL